MGIPATISRKEPLERRRAERWKVRLSARHLDAVLDAQPVTIRDLSAWGFLFETDQQLKVGACLIIEMPGGVSKICKNVWSSGKRYGATFSEPLSDIELNDLVGPGNAASTAFGKRRYATSGQAIAEPARKQTHEVREQNETKLTVRARILIIVAASAALWAPIGLGVWFAVT